jgi:hypothetical protein
MGNTITMTDIYALTIYFKGKTQAFQSWLNDIYILKTDLHSLDLVK